MECREEKKCIFRGDTGGCRALSDTNFDRPCPFRKETEDAGKERKDVRESRFL